MWYKQQATQIVAQLPDNKEEALQVLYSAIELLEWLYGAQGSPPIALATMAAVLAFPGVNRQQAGHSKAKPVRVPILEPVAGNARNGSDDNLS